MNRRYIRACELVPLQLAYAYDSDTDSDGPWKVRDVHASARDGTVTAVFTTGKMRKFLSEQPVAIMENL